MLAPILSYMLAAVRYVSTQHTRARHVYCACISKDSRLGRLFRCISCGFIHHTYCNAGCNIENSGREKLGLPRLFIKILSTLPDYIGPAQVLGYRTCRRPHHRPYGRPYGPVDILRRVKYGLKSNVWCPQGRILFGSGMMCKMSHQPRLRQNPHKYRLITNNRMNQTAGRSSSRLGYRLDTAVVVSSNLIRPTILLLHHGRLKVNFHNSPCRFYRDQTTSGVLLYVITNYILILRTTICCYCHRTL